MYTCTQSNIPAFEEHLQLQGLQAFTFDPKDVSSITEAIEECLGNSDKRAGFVNQSLIASKKMTWHTTAIHYLELFTSLLQKETMKIKYPVLYQPPLQQ
jgi:hypothetical protein